MTFEKTYNSSSLEDTNSLAQKLASIAKKGDVIALYGTLGVGKSVFARAFIKHLTSAPEVPSPTFTLVQEYTASDFEIYHFDLYRLKSPEEVFELGFEEAVYNGVCLIEWPEKAGYYLPKDVFKIEISSVQDLRQIKITVTNPDKQARLEQIK